MVLMLNIKTFLFINVLITRIKSGSTETSKRNSNNALSNTYKTNDYENSNAQTNMIGVPPIRLGPCKWFVDSTLGSNSILNKNGAGTSNSQSRRKDTTAGLLQIPCSVLILPTSNHNKLHKTKSIGDNNRSPNVQDEKMPIYIDLTTPTASNNKNNNVNNKGNKEASMEKDELINQLSIKDSRPLSAFIDTGAQVTVMPLSTARRLRLIPFIDRRYAGQATGVGTVRIIGRIPNLTILFELSPSYSHSWDHDDVDNHKQERKNHRKNKERLRYERRVVKITRDVTVLGIEEQRGNSNSGTKNVDLLIGLDILKELDACVDLKTNCLRVTVRQLEQQQRLNLPRYLSSSDDTFFDDYDEFIDIVVPFIRDDIPAEANSRSKSSSTKAKESNNWKTKMKRKKDSTKSSKSNHAPQSQRSFIGLIDNDDAGKQESAEDNKIEKKNKYAFVTERDSYHLNSENYSDDDDDSDVDAVDFTGV